MIPKPRCVLPALAVLVLAAPAFGQESWDVIHVQGKRVGTIHVRVEPLKDKEGRDVSRVLVDWDLNFKRGTYSAQMTQRWGTIETPNGNILRLDVRTTMGKTTTRTVGDVKDGVMLLRVEGGGNTQQIEIPWSTDVLGPYGAELSLSRDKIKVGDTREVKTFIPDLNRICLTKLVAVSREEIELGAGNDKRSLIRVEQTVAEVDGKSHPEMTSTLWVDDGGQILRSHSSMLGGTDFYRTTEAGAKMGKGRAEFDLLGASFIPTREISNPEKLRSIKYKVTMAEDEPTTIFPNGSRQKVEAGAAKTEATVTVTALGPVEGTAEPLPGPEYSRPNPQINSDDPRVVAHMRKAIGRETDPWAKSAAIERWVAKNLAKKDFEQAFENAAEVAKSLKGDCSEHSVLVAAMCRAAGVPSRCVMGIAYVPSRRAFGPHMWNEVYVNNRWVAIDAAYDQTQVDVTHLKFSDTSLDGVAFLDAFLPVLSVFKQIKIDPVETSLR